MMNSFTKTIDSTTKAVDTIKIKFDANTIYPIISGWVITLMNDYGNMATGRPEVLDLSLIENTRLAEEAMDYFLYKYESQTASTLFLKCLVKAVKYFDAFAGMAGVESFQEFDDDLKKRYREYLDGLSLSKDYKRYLLAVPRTIQRGQ
jgi:hypothetical protein